MVSHDSRRTENSLRGGGLVEETEAHVIVLFLLVLLLLGRNSGGSCCGRSCSSGGRGCGSASRGDGAELGGAGGDHLLKVLAGQLLHHHVHLGVVGLNAHRAEDFLYGIGRDLSSSEGGQGSGGNVTHFKSLKTRNGSTALLKKVNQA